MNISRALVRTLATTTSRAAKGEVHPGYAKLRSKMVHFQVNDGLPVHLKGGVMDKLLFAGTVGLCGVGLSMCFHFYYTMSFPPKVQ